MAKPRRAKSSPTRIAVPIIAAVILLAVGGVLASRFWPDGGTTAHPDRGQSVGQAAPDPSTAVPGPSEESPESEEPSDSSAQQQLEDCQAKIAAGDRMLKDAHTGITHWSAHVQAQTDANSGKITLAEMKAIWKKTKLAGPEDVKRYTKSDNHYQELTGSCDEVVDAPAEIADRLASCAERGDAMGPMMNASEAAMKDWASHLGDMKKSASGHAHNAQGVWIATWRKAPKNINAYEAAEKKFAKAGDCGG